MGKDAIWDKIVRFVKQLFCRHINRYTTSGWAHTKHGCQTEYRCSDCYKTLYFVKDKEVE